MVIERNHRASRRPDFRVKVKADVADIHDLLVQAMAEDLIGRSIVITVEVLWALGFVRACGGQRTCTIVKRCGRMRDRDMIVGFKFRCIRTAAYSLMAQT